MWWPPEIYPGVACCFVRMGDGNAALDHINNLLMGCSQDNYLVVDHDEWINWNALLGATETIAEMLIQSYEDAIKILPALPSAWPDGKVRGLRGYDGFEFGIEWGEGSITRLEVKSHNGGACKLELCAPFPEIDIECEGESISEWEREEDRIRFETEKGETYVLATK